MSAIWLFALCALVVIALIAVANTLSFPRLRPASPIRTPRVSILVPARNEAAVISATVARLLGQDYPAYEVFVLDDGSTDGTAQLARWSAVGDSRLRVIEGAPLPGGWTGKNWACWQLAQQASGEVLIFTDADVRWEADGLRALVGLMQRTRADMFTVWPTQETRTWGERLTVPLIALAVIGYLPELAVRFVPWPVFAAANGQCIAFWREAYLQAGGHKAVRTCVVEDVALARIAKRRGLRLVMADGNGLIRARMYRTWPETRDGLAKSILAGYGGRPTFLLLATAFHWLLFALPWLWLAVGGALPLGSGWPGFPLALVALGVGIRALSAAATRQRVADALLMPVSVALMTAIAARALWWHLRYGGPQWKGRTVSKRTQGSAP